jgi:hypothetical protein
MKQNRWFEYIGMAAFALVLSAMAALTVNAFVVRQSCINGDIVQGAPLSVTAANSSAIYAQEKPNNAERAARPA